MPRLTALKHASPEFVVRFAFLHEHDDHVVPNDPERALAEVSRRRKHDRITYGNEVRRKRLCTYGFRP